MELIKIINARKTLDGFSEKEELSAHLAYWMTKFVVRTREEHEFYVQEYNKIFLKFANLKDEEEKTYVIPTEAVSAFNLEVEKLEKTDVEDPGIRFNLSELSAELKLSMKQMYPLLDFIDEEN